MSHAPRNKIRYPLGFTGNTNVTPNIPRALRTSNFKRQDKTLYTAKWNQSGIQCL